VKGVPKFADIGLITEAGKDVSSVGSLNYMPPEGPGEPTGDVFSLGKVFYGLFMGMPCKCFPEPPGAAEEFATVPALLQLNSLILKACHHDPRQRFQTANELHQALLAVTETVQEKPPGIGVGARKATGAPEGRPAASGERRPKARWPRIAALLVLLLLIAGAVFLAIKRDPIVVLMDTTAPGGVYDPDNRDNGGSNAKEVAKVLQEQNLLPSRSLHQERIDLDWNREAYVLSLRPDLVIIHRSAFFHALNSVLGLKKVEKPKTPEEEKENDKWQAVYDECDHKLRMLIVIIGTREPRTKFLVYSRGTDTKWLEPGYQQEKWIKPLQADFPELKHRITTMTINPGENGSQSFRNPETGKEVRNHVKTILGLPGKPE
jgi:hypothetical protein